MGSQYTRWFVARFLRRMVAIVLLGPPIVAFAPFVYIGIALAELYNRLYHMR